jgi:hypothetical protein
MAGKRNNTLTEDIFQFIIDYADSKNGPTPTIWEIAESKRLPYSTVYHHIQKLQIWQRITILDNKLVVNGSEWLPPGVGLEDVSWK